MHSAQPQVLKLVLDDESCTIDEWLQSIRDKVTRARIIRQIDKLDRGNFGDHKSVGKGVHELRLFFGAGYRVYYGMVGSTFILLLGGSDKNEQSAAIAKAQDLWSDFETQNLDLEKLQSWTKEEQLNEDESI